MQVTISRKAHFNAAHRLFNPNWSDQKNFEVFGKCSNPNFHGHNYEMIVSITGEINPETGFVMNLDDLKAIIFEQVEEYLDHKNLNVEIPEFRNLNPTVENISVVIWNRIRERLDTNLKLKITLFETPRNFVEYSGN